MVGYAGEPGNQWSGWKLGFYSPFCILPQDGDVSQVHTEVSWEGEVSP
jgi:hypothetical protein